MKNRLDRGLTQEGTPKQEGTMPEEHWSGEIPAPLLDNLVAVGFDETECMNLLVVIARLGSRLEADKKLTVKDMAVAHGLLCRFAELVPAVVNEIVHQSAEKWMDERRESLQPSVN